MKKLLSIFLAVVFLLVLTSTKVDAFSGLGDGSQTYPYRITTCEQFQEIQNNIWVHYVLMNDIDCTDTINWNSGSGFTPIGGLYGSLDGRNYTVNGIYMLRNGNSDNVGVISQINGGTVKNLRLTNVDITAVQPGTEYIGGLVGYTDNATIQGVSVTGSVTGNTVVGGFAGYIGGSTVDRSSFSGDSTDIQSYGGGFIGFILNSSVSNSYATGTYTGGNVGAGFAGRLIADNAAASITNSYFVGTTQNSNYRAGFVSWLDEYGSGQATVSNSFVVASGTPDGVTPQSTQPFASGQGTPTVTNFYFDETEAGTASCGFSLTCTAVNSDGLDPNHFKGLTANTVDPMASGTGNWNFTDIWQANSNDHPTLQDDTLGALTPLAAPGAPDDMGANKVDVHTTEFYWDPPVSTGGSQIINYSFQYRLVGAGSWTTILTEDDSEYIEVELAPGDYEFRVAGINGIGLGTYEDAMTYTVPPLPDPEISNCEELQAIADEPSGDYYLTNNIDCSMTNPADPDFDIGGPWSDEEGFQPISDFSGSLDGFDGDGSYTITGLYINRPNSWGQALFGSINNASITNIGLESIEINGYGATSSLAAYAYESNVIDTVYVSGNINASYTNSGLVAYAQTNEVDEEVSINNVTINVSLGKGNEDNTSNWGGVVGSYSSNNGSLNIDGAYLQIQIDYNTNGVYSAGGVVGDSEIYNATSIIIQNSIVSGSMNVGAGLGGLIGYQYGEGNGADRPTIQLTNNIVEAELTAQYEAGGLIAYLEAYSIDTAIFQSTYDNFDDVSTISATADGNVGGLIGVAENYNDSTLSIDQTYVNASLSATGDNAGGFIGEDSHITTITDSYFNGSISVAGAYNVGGLVATELGNLTVDTSYVAGDSAFAENGHAGGLVGYSTGEALFNNVFVATTPEVSTGEFGFIVGLNDGSIDSESRVYADAGYLNPDQCYGNQANDGTCILINENGDDENHFLANTSNTPFTINNAAVWDFNNAWSITDSYPCLQWQVDCGGDEDGVPNDIENAAPGDGDGNGDGLLDSRQENVLSFVHGVTGKYVTIEVGDDSMFCTAQDPTSSDEDNHDTRDAGYQYTNGFVHFEASCALPEGYTMPVMVIFHGVASTDFVARKYNPNTNAYFTIPGARLSLDEIGGNPVTILDYSITDGGNLDTDGEVNGQIVDPVGLATSVVNVPNTGFLKN